MQDDAEKRRTCDAAAAEVQGIMQGRMPPHGGPYAPPPRAAFNAVGPPQQVAQALDIPWICFSGSTLCVPGASCEVEQGMRHAAVEEVL